MSSLFRLARKGNHRRDSSSISAVRSGGCARPASAGCVERLEHRTFLSANISVANIDSARTAHTVTVVYSDPDGIDTGTIDASDLSIGSGVQVVVTDPGEPGTTVTATYSLIGPGGSWDDSDNGRYNVSISASAVGDGTGGPMDSGDSVSFTVDVPEPDNSGPSVNVSVGNVSSAGGATHTVSVTYSDSAGINQGSIDTGDITVTLGGSSLNVIDVNQSGGSNTRTAVYTFQAPGGSWDQSDNGSYTVTVNAGAVQDNSPAGNGNAQESDNFNVDVPPPADETGPSASISVDNVTASAATHSVTVNYADNVALNHGSIGANDITVSGPGGVELSVTDAQIVAQTASSATVVYTVAGPGGSFDPSDNGAYTVALAAGSVRDDSGNGASAAPANFNVAIAAPPPVDTTGPTAAISPVGTILTAGGSSVNVVVTYTDDTLMDASTIGAADIAVTRVGAGTDMTVTDASAQVSADGKTVVATYTVRPAGGTFDFADNGAYQIAVRSAQVKDAAGNNVTAATDTFLVAVLLPGPGDTTPPSANISAGNITAAGGASHTVTVTYTDDVGIDTGTISPSDIDVTGPGGGELDVTGVSTSVSNGGKTVTVTYTVAAPGGSFDAADNGTYTVSLNANAVRDTAGNAATGSNDTFSVNLTTAPPPDEAGPTANISAANIIAPGGVTHTVTVVYTDEGGRVRAGSIGTDDIVVARDGTAVQVTDVSTTSQNGGSQITAVYTLAAPGGTWDGADNGTYTITLAAGAVSDTRDNGNAAAQASFTVGASLSDAAAPTVSGISSPNISAEGVTSQTVTVTYTDDAGLDLQTIGAEDVTVTGPGGALAVNVVDISASEDNRTATVKYVFAAPGGAATFTDAHNGTYTVTLAAGAVSDLSGKPAAGAGSSFQVGIFPAGPIDPGFGSGNAVLSNFVAEAVATSDTGKVLVAGRSGDNAVVEVRNPDGTLDTSFNRTGRVVSTTDVAYYAVVAQGDKVVVAGTTNGQFVLVRYHADGRIDQSFGINGRIELEFGQDNDAAYALAIAPDGKLVAAGQSDGNFAIARLDANGRRDPTFGSGGQALFDLGGNDLAGAIVVQSDGKIVAAGTTNGQVGVIRIQTNGLQDSTEMGSASPFSGDGMLIVSGLAARNDAAVADRSAALALQADGRILVGNHTASGDFGIVRITTAGNIDGAFGNDGLATADFSGGSDDADAIIVQPTGEILVVGTSLSGATGSTTLAAFDSSGKLIEAFGTGGKLTLDTGMTSTARELHLGDLVLRAFGTRQADGRVVVGTTNSAPQVSGGGGGGSGGSQSSLRRLNVPGTRSVTSGSLIGTFGVVNGRSQKFEYTDLDGTKMVFTIRGGTGSVFLGNDGRFNVVLTDGGTGGCTVTVRGRGGDGRIALGDVTANGSVKSLSAKTGDLAGTFSSAGAVGKLVFGNVSDGAICAAGSITSITAASLTNVKLLAGSNLGANAEFGGTGANADSYAGASIGTLRVSGAIVGCTVGAGLDPVDATFLDEDDRVIDGAESFIRRITARSADGTSRFLAGDFGTVRLGGKVSPETDQRFRVLQ